MQLLDGITVIAAIAWAAMDAVVKPAENRKLFGRVVVTVALIHMEGVLPVTPGGAVLFSIIVADMLGGPSAVAYRHPACSEVVGGVVTAARVAVGACGPMATRLPDLEAAMLGNAVDPGVVQAVHLAGLAPIDDIRGDAGYRRVAALELVRRAIGAVA